MTQPQPIVADTRRSPHARLRPVPLNAVRLADPLWSARLASNRATTLPTQARLIEETGRVNNFRRAAAAYQGDFNGWFFNDSDVYKWLEGAAWMLAQGSDAELEAVVTALIGEIEAAQGADGYLNTYYTLERAGERWSSLISHHELYCAGHLIQAAVAHQRATGDDRLLNVARRFADLIDNTFGPASAGKTEGTDGHPEIEMALVELYRLTGEVKYLRQAEYFLDARGRGLLGGAVYSQDDTPFRDRAKLDGHAVRALYLCCGAADIYAETGDAALWEALDRQWRHMTARQMYISGGLGARHVGESFGDDYELPNFEAYAETCAAIASVMWNWRMLIAAGEPRFADLLEHTLYNAVLPGLALDGAHYFYVNPLANDGSHRRQPWFECACCPPNLARTLPTVGGYFYAADDDGLWVHLYGESDTRLTLTDGRSVEIAQRTAYPWDGEIALTIHAESPLRLRLRIPGWSADSVVTLTVNGQPRAAASGTYAALDIGAGESLVKLSLPMPVRLVESHPRVTENVGKVGLLRGPILYAFEGVDNPGINLDAVALTGSCESRWQADLLGGVVTLQAAAHAITGDTSWGERLYRVRDSGAGGGLGVSLLAIPYYAWGSRHPAPMRVWLYG